MQLLCWEIVLQYYDTMADFMSLDHHQLNTKAWKSVCLTISTVKSNPPEEIIGKTPEGLIDSFVYRGQNNTQCTNRSHRYKHYVSKGTDESRQFVWKHTLIMFFSRKIIIRILLFGDAKGYPWSVCAAALNLILRPVYGCLGCSNQPLVEPY